ncbi:MAG: hypothetical protein FWC23_03385 [Chitinispirillia bacterium]|nr:hypothetical protein [Chitinispirillia bacterium]MCL2268219.1 hypothetical protein [Chitinispirillia bacterium]
MIPEIILPAGAAQIIGQPLADLAYEYAVAKATGQDTRSKEWWIQTVASLAASAGFAIRDVASGNHFSLEQAKQRGEVGNALGLSGRDKGKLRGWLYGKEGHELEIVDPATLTTRGEAQAQLEAGHQAIRVGQAIDQARIRQHRLDADTRNAERDIDAIPSEPAVVAHGRVQEPVIEPGNIGSRADEETGLNARIEDGEETPPKRKA